MTHAALSGGGSSGPGELNQLAYKFGMPNYVIEQWSIVDNPHNEDAYRAVIQAMAEITTTARQRADDDFPLGDAGEYVNPTARQAAAGLGRIVVREPALGSAYGYLSVAMRRWRLGVVGTRPRARYQRPGRKGSAGYRRFSDGQPQARGRQSWRVCRRANTTISGA